MIYNIQKNYFICIIYIFALFVVLMLSVFIKPFGNPDEGAHFLRAYEISKGHFLNTKNNIGIKIPCSTYEIITKKYSRVAFEQEFDKNNINDKNCFVNSKNTAGLYSPIPYIFISTGFIISDLLNFSIEKKLIFSRALNAIISLSLIFLFVILIGHYKHLFTFIIITPMFLVSLASISADPLLYVSIFAYLYLIVKVLENNEKIKNYFFYFLMVAFLLGSIKIVYAGISGLYLIVIKLKKNVLYYTFIFIPIIVAFLTSILFSSMSDKSLIYLGNGAAPIEQLAYIKSNFIHFIYISFESVFDYKVLRNLFFPNYLFGENYFLLMYYSFIFMIFALTEKTKILNSCKKFFIIIISVVLILLITLSLYLVYNPPGYMKILGLQARYFIPVIILISTTLSLKENLFYINIKIKNALLIFTLCTNFYLIYIKYI